VVGQELVDPPGNPLRHATATVRPVAAVGVARRATVVVDLDQARQLQRRRAVHVRVAVAGERRETGLRREVPLAAGLDAPVQDRRVQRLDGEFQAGDGPDQLARPRAYRHHALGAVELGAGARRHHDASPILLGCLPDADDLRLVPDHGALLDGERLEHGHRLGRVQDAAAVLAHRGHPPVGDPERAAPPPRQVRLLRAGAPDGGEQRGAGAWPHGELRRRGQHAVARLGLGLRPEAAREADHRRVLRLRVGVADGAGLAVRGAQVVQQVEALQEQDPRAAGRRRVRRAAAHDARAHHDDVEVEAVAGGSGLGACVRGGHGAHERVRSAASWRTVTVK